MEEMMRGPGGKLARDTFPVLVTGGTGLLLAGFILEYAEGLEVVKRQPSLIALVPILLGLKCNLEMTLASRLGTAFHLGHISSLSSPFSPFSPSSFESRNPFADPVILSNLGVTQLQALGVSLLSVLIVEGRHWLSLDFDWFRSLFLLSTSFAAAGLTTLVLGILTTVMLYYSSKYSIDPDNVLGPLTASFGDMLAIVILFACGTFFSSCSSLFLLLLLLLSFGAYPRLMYAIARKSQKTCRVLYDGWRPLLIALCLSSAGGFLLEGGLWRLEGGLSIFLPLVNGVPGNIAGVYSSRIASALHKKSDDRSARKTGPFGPIERVLLLLPVPTHIIFFLITVLTASRSRILSPLFLPSLLAGSVFQVFVLLLMTKRLARISWEKGLDPDNHVIPYLTATSDLIGTASLVFFSLYT